MSTNGSRPRGPIRRLPGSRRVHLALGAATALVLAGVLVAPVVLIGSGPGTSGACSSTILFKGRHYTARTTGRVVEAIAIGVGVISGCGNAPENVDLRSVAGVPMSRAVALASDPSVAYVRRGVCPHLARAPLLRCLEGGRG